MAGKVKHRGEVPCETAESQAHSETGSKCVSEAKTRNEYLVKQMSFYGAYHSTFGNQIIHVIFVPIILITAFAMLSHIKLLMYPVKLVWFANHYFHMNTPLCLIYILMYPATYIYIDFFCGLTWLPMGAFVWIAAMFLVDTLKCSMSTLLLIHSISWAFQFLGHGIIEKRKPALFDNLYQSIVLAPFFVWFESVLFPLGYGHSIGLKRIISRNAKALQLKLDQKV